MAYDYEKIKAQYEALSPDKQKQFAEMNKNDTSGNFQKFMNQYNSEKNQSANTVKNNTQNTGSTVSNNNVSNTKYGEPTEYQGTGGSNKTSPYANQGAGNYSYSDQTQYYEKNGQNSSASNSIRDKWDSMDYDQQQEFLKNNPNAKSGIVKAGGTIKQSPYENQGEGQYVYNPNTKYYEKVGGQGGNQGGNQGGWDYQDNSPERMQQMARNVNDLAQSDPWIFNSEDSFRKFFIDGKGRTPEQEAFLMDLYKNMKIYNQYDGYTAEEVGNMFAHGKVPESYLSYVKNSNPDRYAAIMDAKDKEQNKIKDKSNYDSLLEQAGFKEEKTEDTNAIKFMKENGMLVDENGDWTDDGLYPEPSEEERTMVNRVNEIIARRLEIKNIRKNLERDYTKAYPGATKATIVALVNDAMSELQAEDDDLAVELAQLQGQVNYEQSERKLQADARQNTINNIAKNYGMYYQYTPEGMSELAQAKYAATNVTLDQADNGTDTQKQMALDSVLTDYFDKYGSIIQRSKSQVINDVMKLAKDKGITLSQALQENFITPLKNKDEFEILSTGRTISNSSADKWAKLTDDKLFNTATGEIIDANGNVVGNTGGVGSTSQTGAGKSYTVVSSTQLVSGLSDFLDGYNVGDKGGQCGAFVNKGLKAIGVADSNLYDNSLDSKLKSKNEEADATAQTGWVAIYDPSKLTGAGAEHGHVGWVVKDNGDGTVAIIDSNGTKNAEGKYDETVGYHPSVSKSSLYGYFNPTKSNGSTEDADLYNAKVLSWIPTQLRNTDVEKQWYIDIAKGLREKGLSSFEAAMAIMGFDIKNDSPEAQATKEKILNTTMAQGDEIIFNSSTLASMAESINAGNYEGALKTLENQLGKYVAKQLGNDLSRDNMSEAMQAISDFDRINTNWTQGTWNRLSSYLGAEGGKTIQFNSDLANLSATMRKLGYSEDEIENLLPKQSYNKTEFKKSIDTLQKNILNKYNMIRQNHGMPAESRASLLGNIPLSSVYGLNAEMEAMDII